MRDKDASLRPSRGGYERVEQQQVGGVGREGELFGMPLYTDDPRMRIGALQAFDHAVSGKRGGHQPLANAVDGLVVERVRVACRRAHDVGEAAAIDDGHFVRARVPRRRRIVHDVPLAFRCEILEQRATEGDIADLDAAADGEDRQVARTGFGNQGDLIDVASRIDGAKLRVRCRAVSARLDVFATGEQEAVTLAEELHRLVVREARAER